MTPEEALVLLLRSAHIAPRNSPRFGEAERTLRQALQSAAAPSEKELAEIAQRHAATTQGGWRHPADYRFVEVVFDAMNRDVLFDRLDGTDADMTFIAAAHQDVPDLLAACRRALALIRDLSSDNATERYRAGWEARVCYGEWTTLGELPKGALFETKRGTRAVKSEYHYGNEPGSQCQCVLLESGEYAHFPQRNKEPVREIRIKGVTR